ncbi:phosphoribosyl-dephospho-CoA transferase MdcG domain-containing protein, partial [Klebsiella pneumoniae]|uniref:phosphoribosyl-dephospho-CoA transferase MdcG domain-containing protein n=1 Tax=Klebsiella pneumoniae TaxID=573 RepID=UPI00336AC800
MLKHANGDDAVKAVVQIAIILQTRVAQLPCRADTQVDTPYGAFALNEWLRDGRALLKT